MFSLSHNAVLVESIGPLSYTCKNNRLPRRMTHISDVGKPEFYALFWIFLAESHCFLFFFCGVLFANMTEVTDYRIICITHVLGLHFLKTCKVLSICLQNKFQLLGTTLHTFLQR